MEWKKTRVSESEIVIHEDGLKIATAHLIDNKVKEHDNVAELIIKASALKDKKVECVNLIDFLTWLDKEPLVELISFEDVIKAWRNRNEG